MTYAILGRGPDGILDVGFGGMLEPYDKVAVCFWDHQRQPFYICDIDKVRASDISVALKKSRGVEIGFVPLSTRMSFTVECGTENQREQVREASQNIAFATNSPAYRQGDRERNQLLRNLMVVAYEDDSGRITPFTNMLTHQWDDNDEDRYGERLASNRVRLHFFIVNSIDSVNISVDEINV